ncbi:hypothetical protein BJF78_31530 [Pseudonocardia sp. CNS-139]|nr:hypothetical protein BJF78_31530 [Pseudonocardia sp. CNS-139]
MTAQVFVKHYDDSRRAAAARAHRDWLAGLGSGVRIPDLHATTADRLEFEHLGHHQPGPADLPTLAHTLGQLHAVAYGKHLHAARIDVPFTTSDGLLITDFPSPRRTMLDRMPVPAAELPVALYKDANIRNFLLTDTGPAIIDFDDLTLAPFGYDLAKLVVSTAMTHGRLALGTVDTALETYNACTTTTTLDAHCPLDRLAVYAEFHHLCTAPYLHRNGYRYSWPQVRPWPA